MSNLFQLKQERKIKWVKDHIRAVSVSIFSQLVSFKNFYQIKKYLNSNKYIELIAFIFKWWNIPKSKKKEDFMFLMSYNSWVI